MKFEPELRAWAAERRAEAVRLAPTSPEAARAAIAEADELDRIEVGIDALVADVWRMSAEVMRGTEAELRARRGMTGLAFSRWRERAAQDAGMGQWPMEMPPGDWDDQLLSYIDDNEETKA